MTYAFITEWMSKEEAEKFDRDLRDDPRRAAATQNLAAHQQLMAVFGMPSA